MYNLNDKIHRYWTEGMDDTRVEYRFDYSVCEKCELKANLQKESALLKETRDCLIESQKMHKRCADNAVKIICHHKFKRCLDKACLCESEEKRLEAIAPIFDTDKECWEYNSDYWKKWHVRWLEFAEHFKETRKA